MFASQDYHPWVFISSKTLAFQDKKQLFIRNASNQVLLRRNPRRGWSSLNFRFKLKICMIRQLEGKTNLLFLFTIHSEVQFLVSSFDFTTISIILELSDQLPSDHIPLDLIHFSGLLYLFANNLLNKNCWSNLKICFSPSIPHNKKKFHHMITSIAMLHNQLLLDMESVFLKLFLILEDGFLY